MIIPSAPVGRLRETPRTRYPAASSQRGRKMAKYVGAIDQGTTSTRFILFDEAGEVVTLARREHAQICPQPGWVEHDATEIWRNTLAVIDDALAKASAVKSDLAAIGVANQRETTVLWDKATGAPLCNAIVWMDTRTQALVARFASDGGTDRLRARTGLPLASYFSGLKLVWLFENLPGARRAREMARFCLAPSTPG